MTSRTSSFRPEKETPIPFERNLLTRNDVVAIAAAIAPYDEIRKENRRLIGSYVEVYCKCPIEELVKRDVKGLYAKALKGEIKNFTGVSDPYEEPLDAEVIVETDKETEEESAAKIVKTLEITGYIPADQTSDYSEEEEEEIKARLKDLGYI